MARRTSVSVEPFALVQLAVSYCCHKFGVLDLYILSCAQSCGTCSRAAGTPSSPVQHDGGRTSILLRLLRRRMASSLRNARARRLFLSGCRGAADSGEHEKSRDHLHNLQQAPSDVRWDSICSSGPEGSRAGTVGFIRLRMSRKLLTTPPDSSRLGTTTEQLLFGYPDCQLTSLCLAYSMGFASRPTTTQHISAQYNNSSAVATAGSPLSGELSNTAPVTLAVLSQTFALFQGLEARARI
jgi:hypothetical protein